MKNYILLTITALFLAMVSLYGIKSNEFLYLHDEFLTLSKTESINLAFTRNNLDLGIANTTVYMLTIIDRFYYLSMYMLGASHKTIQVVLYIVKFLMLTIIPYLGFKKIAELYSESEKNQPINDLTTLIITLFYGLNTFTVIYFNGNGFSLTLLTCYVLAPLALFLGHKSLAENNLNVKYKMLFLIVIYLMSFALTLFIVFAFILSIYIFVTILINKVKVINIVKNFSIVTILYLPFTLFYAIILRETYITVTETVNLTGGETYNLLKGGLLTQLLMQYSWGIYTYWEPRNIFTFYKFYDGLPSLIAPLLVLLIIIWGIFKGKKTLKRENLFKSTLLVFFLFLIQLFLIKGPQEPFGDIYLYLINNFSAFRVFRSPDSKFGFGLVLTICMLLVLVSRYYRTDLFKSGVKKSWLLNSALVAVILIQGFPIYAGIAIKGQNTSYSSDRVVHIPYDYQQVADFFKKEEDITYVNPVPPIEFGHYTIAQNETHIGQDLLPKIFNNPKVSMLYISEHSGISSSAYNALKETSKKGDLNVFSEFPIKYFIVRNDLKHTEENKILATAISQTAKEVLKNETFIIYENQKYKPIIEPENVSIEYINPSKYKVTISNLSESQDLIFNQNFNVDWAIYPLMTNKQTNAVELQDILYLGQPNLFNDSHVLESGYANKWTINKNDILTNLSDDYYTLKQGNSSNEIIDISFILFHKTQALFYLTMIISTTYLIILLGLTIYVHKDEKQYV